MSEKTYNISKNSAPKSASDGDCLWPVWNFLESSNSKRKKRYGQISVFFKKIWLNLVKLLIQEVLMLLHNYSRILVLLNNYFNFLNFGQIWSNYGQTVVKLWSNYGQINYSRNISVTIFFGTIVSNSNSEMCDFMLKLNS